MFHNVDNPDRLTHYVGLMGQAPLKWPLEKQAARYITRVTLQGDGEGPSMGIWADENVYAQSAPRPPLCCSTALIDFAQLPHIAAHTCKQAFVGKTALSMHVYGSCPCKAL